MDSLTPNCLFKASSDSKICWIVRAAASCAGVRTECLSPGLSGHQASRQADRARMQHPGPDMPHLPTTTPRTSAPLLPLPPTWWEQEQSKELFVFYRAWSLLMGGGGTDPAEHTRAKMKINIALPNFPLCPSLLPMALLYIVLKQAC